MHYQDYTLDRFQQEAIQWIEKEQSLIVSAPTGAGKTVIAEYAIEKALGKNRQVIYTAPIKALSNQKFRDFSKRYGDKVGIMTGDLTLNGEAPIVIMTTEIFRNALFENSHRFDDVLYLVFDEIHFLNDAERGSVWEESLIFAPLHIKVLCLSATVPNVEDLADWISSIRETPMRIVHEDKRPVPLSEYCFMEGKGVVELDRACHILPKKRKKYEDTVAVDPQVLDEILLHLQERRQMPSLYFVFSRRDCEAHARQCADQDFLTAKESKQVKERLRQFSHCYNIKCDPKLGLGALFVRGVAYHHAGMLPAFKEIVEQLFTDGLIKVLFATETFALGVNMPATSVVFSRLKKYDGISVRYLKVLEYQQMSGRAGRRGIDSQGYVYANLHDHVITRRELERILHGPLEPIFSQFNLSYNTLLNVYGRVGKEVIKTCDKSFGTFQRTRQAQLAGDKKQKKKITSQQRADIKKKLSFLQTLGYLNQTGLTSKGRFAININGYELQITEIFFDGFMEDCDEVTLFVILVAIVFEGKKNTRYGRLPKELKKTARKVEQRLMTLNKMEYMYGIESLKLPDFRLSAAARAWVLGARFQDLSNFCHASPGDIIRTFRMSVQMCRQLRKACNDYQEFVEKLDRCILAINRDEANALKQLKAFSALAKPRK